MGFTSKAALVPVTFGLLVLAISTQAAPRYVDPVSVGWQQNDWKTLSTEHFRIHHEAHHQDSARRVAGIAEALYRELTVTLEWQPQAPTEVVLVDDYDVSNGWATPYPFNQMRLFLSPPDGINTLEDYDSWLNMLIRHEFTHVLHLDKARGLPGNLRDFLGRMPLLYPAVFQPSWFLEGYAVHQETDKTQGLGRGQSSYYAMAMRQEVVRGIRDLEEVNAPRRNWPVGASYLYGTYFMEFIAENYGQASLRELIEQYSDNLVPFWLNPTARKVTGKSYPALWQEFEAWLHRRFDSQIRTLGAKSMPMRPVTRHGGHPSPLRSEGDALYYQQNDGNGPVALMRFSNGRSQAVCKLWSEGNFDVHGEFGIVIAQSRLYADNRFYSDLYLLRDGQLHALTHRGRYRDAQWLPDGSLVARTLIGGVSSLVHLTAKGKVLETIWQGQRDEVLGEYDVHPDGSRLVAAVKRVGRSFGIEEFDLQRRRWTVLASSPAIEGQPEYAPDGSVIFVADYDGVYNVYQIRGSSAPVLITRTESGVFYPTLGEDGSLYVQRYGDNGFDVYRQSPVVTSVLLSLGVTQPLAVELPFKSAADVAQSPGAEVIEDYQPWPSLVPQWWFPYWLASPAYTQFGFSTAGQDALGRHQYAVTVAADTDQDEPLGLVNYRYSNQYQIDYQRELDYWTSGGDVLGIRAEDRLGLSRLNLWTALHDELAVHAGLTREKEHAIYTGDIGWGSQQEVESSRVGIALTFDNAESYRYSLGPAWGRRVDLVTENLSVLHGHYHGSMTRLDWREYFGLPGSQVLALRVAGTYGEAYSEPVELGGFDPVISEPLFGHDSYALRGYEDNVFVGQSVQLNSLEWRMPLSRIERTWNIYPVGLQELNLTLFADNGALWHHQAQVNDGHYYTGYGAELEMVFTLAYNLDLPLHIGYAQGDDDQYGEQQWYLSLGAAF